jgi:WD40 repeat protein
MKKGITLLSVLFSLFCPDTEAQNLILNKDNAHQDGVTVLCLSADATIILSGGMDMKTYLWNTQTLEKGKGAMKLGDKVTALAISETNKFYVSGSADMKIRVFDIEQNMPTLILSEHTAEITALAINPINNYFASGSKDNTVRIWDNSKSKKSLFTLKGHEKEITGLAFSPDGKTLCSASLDNTIRFWDPATGILSSSTNAGLKGVKAIAFSSDGKLLIAGGVNGNVLVLDGSTGKKITELEGFKSEINSVSISGDGQYIAAAGKSKNISIWKLEGGKMERTLPAHENDITGVAFSNNGDILVSGSMDGGIKIWDVKDLKIGKRRYVQSAEASVLAAANLTLNDDNNNGILEAGEKASLVFELNNQGKGPAFRVTARVSLDVPNPAIKFEKEVAVGNLDANKKQSVKIPLTLNADLQAGTNAFTVVVSDANGGMTPPLKLNFQTSGANSFSYIMVLGESYSSATGMADIGAPITAKVKIKNITKGEAKNIKMNFLLPENVYAVNKLSEVIPVMAAGEEKEILLDFYADKKFILPEIKIGMDIQGVAFTNAKDIILKIKMKEKLPMSEDFSGEVLAQAAQIEQKESPTETKPLMRGGGADPLKGLNVKVSKDMVIGNYYALIIGIDKYKAPWPTLSNAVNDAKALEKTLRASYKFDHFKTLYNEQATRESIIKELEALVATVKEGDNVFIYYSGHGDYKKELNKGFWVPSDAEATSTSKYISNSDIQTYINGIKSKHTLLISDACFSGDIFRGNTVTTPFEESEKYYKEVHNLVSRQALTSGGIEPVMDGGKEGHSVFAYYLLKTLEANQGKYFDASQLYTKIKIPVINNSEQTPKFSPIKNAGDEGGQFIFIKK